MDPRPILLGTVWRLSNASFNKPWFDGSSQKPQGGGFLGFRENGWLDAAVGEANSIRSQAADRVTFRLKHSHTGSGWPRNELGRDGRLLLIHRGHGHSVTGRVGIQEPVGNWNHE